MVLQFDAQGWVTILAIYLLVAAYVAFVGQNIENTCAQFGRRCLHVRFAPHVAIADTCEHITDRIVHNLLSLTSLT